MQREFQIDVRWLAFPLHPETPPEGRTLKDLFAGRNIDIPRMLSRLKQVAQDLDLPFGDRLMTYNSRRAQELGKWAEQMGRGVAFHDAAFRTYFAHGRNIYEKDTLLNIVTTAGLDSAAAIEVLDSGEYKAAVDQDWERAYQSGVTAVPTFVAGGQKLVGAQPYPVLEEFINQRLSIL